MSLRSIAVFAFAALPLFAEEKKMDGAALKGKWEVVAAEFNGEKSKGLQGRMLLFSNDEFTAYDGKTKGSSISFKLDSTTSPKSIDLTRSGKDTKALGIFSIEGDELKMCYGEPGATRPGKFESATGSKVFLLVLKRVKD